MKLVHVYSGDFGTYRIPEAVVAKARKRYRTVRRTKSGRLDRRCGFTKPLDSWGQQRDRQEGGLHE
jgi:hypothetical protein